eukprot:6204297-Pleurochrysis_carterae.AAC.10
MYQVYLLCATKWRDPLGFSLCSHDAHRFQEQELQLQAAASRQIAASVALEQGQSNHATIKPHPPSICSSASVRIRPSPSPFDSSCWPQLYSAQSANIASKASYHLLFCFISLDQPAFTQHAQHMFRATCFVFARFVASSSVAESTTSVVELFQPS